MERTEERTGWNKQRVWLHARGFPSGQVCHPCQCLSPRLHLGRIHLPLFEFLKCIRKASRLVSQIGRPHLVENGEHNLPHHFLAVENFHQLIQAPRGRSIVPGKDDDGLPGILDGSQELARYALTSLEPITVPECKDSLARKSMIQMVREVCAGVFTTEA